MDVTLTNKPDLFQDNGVYDPVISDHCMVYGVVKERAVQHNNTIIKVPSYKNLDEVRFKEELSLAPWLVGEVFDLLDDRYAYWETPLKDIVDEYLPIKQMKVRDIEVTSWLVSADDFSSRVARGANERVSAANE